MVSAAGAISMEVLKGMGKKLPRTQKKKLQKKKTEKGFNIPKNNILQQSLGNPKRVQLPDDRVFLTK